MWNWEEKRRSSPYLFSIYSGKTSDVLESILSLNSLSPWVLLLLPEFGQIGIRKEGWKEAQSGIMNLSNFREREGGDHHLFKFQYPLRTSRHLSPQSFATSLQDACLNPSNAKLHCNLSGRMPCFVNVFGIIKAMLRLQ